MNEHETDQTHFREHQADSAPRGGDPNGKQIRLGLNQEPPSNSHHLQEQIETKQISGWDHLWGNKLPKHNKEEERGLAKDGNGYELPANPRVPNPTGADSGV